MWAALSAVYVIWGSTYLAIRLMVRTIPPVLGSGGRFVVAGAVLLLIVAVRGGGLRSIRITAVELGSCAIVGALLAAGGNGLVTIAERHVPSGLTSLLVASVPLWIVVYRSALGDRVSPRTLGGVAFGLAGLGVLLLVGHRPQGAPLGSCLVVVAAALCWALGSFLLPRLRPPTDPLVSTAWQMACGGALLLVIAAPAGEYGQVHDPSAKSIGGLVYLILVGSIIGYSAYTWLLHNAPISKVSTYAFVNPVVAVALGAIFLSEDLTATMLIATVMIVASVATIVRAEAPRAPALVVTEEP